MSPVYQIEGTVQNYSWGKVGSSSKVAQLLCGKNIEEDKPYAELWMGTHPKGPSTFTKDGSSLAEFIDKNREVLGNKVKNQFGNLPYLFKVLSVARSLSIQAHPDKKLAEKLHTERPDVYKDANHKPEMAIALTRFEALCGFRPVKEILDFFEAVPELANVIGKESIALLKNDIHQKSGVSDGLKSCFSNLILCEKAKLVQQLNSLITRVKKMVSNETDTSNLNGELLLRLYSQFPDDVGCFVVYFLNHIFLEPGEALFLAANVPHAYLSGDCIECMACSDNVVRAGLTPKLVDAETLCSMLKYVPSTIEGQKFKPVTTGDQYELQYNPPIDDFAVSCVKIPAGTANYALSLSESASIVLVVSGKATLANNEESIISGNIFFIPAQQTLEMSTATEVLIYRATCIF